jgi:aminoglycoside phosphotransferase (APT) family kinase protein
LMEVQMSAAVESLIGRLERTLSLTYQATETLERPCRAGQLFRVRFGERSFALKFYNEGYFNDVYLHRALAATDVPVPAIHACDESRDLVGKPWVLMDWVEGDNQVTDLRLVARQAGRLLREIHALRVDGAGARGAGGWEFPDWHALVGAQANQDRAAIERFDDTAAHRALYLQIVDDFVGLGRSQPKQSFLLHGDLGLDNIIVDENRIVGIIDAGWIVGGHPLLDLAYSMNSRLGVGEGMRGLLEGYGETGRAQELVVLRLYQWIGKLIHFNATGQRQKYHERRRLLLELVAQHERSGG